MVHITYTHKHTLMVHIYTHSRRTHTDGTHSRRAHTPWHWWCTHTHIHIGSAATVGNFKLSFSHHTALYYQATYLLTLRIAILQSLCRAATKVCAYQLKACSLFYLMPPVPNPLVQLAGGDFLFTLSDCWPGIPLPYTCTLPRVGVGSVRLDLQILSVWTTPRIWYCCNR